MGVAGQTPRALRRTSARLKICEERQALVQWYGAVPKRSNDPEMPAQASALRSRRRRAHQQRVRQRSTSSEHV